MPNSVPNPEFTTDTSSWGTTGTASMARITSDYNITPACLDVLTGTDFLGVANSGWAAGEHVGETWSGSGYIKAKTGADIGKTVDLVLIANGTAEQFGKTFTLTNTWQKVTLVCTWTDPGITSLRIDFRAAAAVATAFFLDTVEASQVVPGPIYVAKSFAASNNGGGASVGVPVSGIQTGDLLIVASSFDSDASNPTVAVPSDDQGNTYTQRAASTWGLSIEIVTSLCDAVVAGTPPTTVTVNSAAGLGATGIVLVVRGFNPTNYADQFAAGTAFGTSIGPSATTSVGGTRLIVVTLANAFGVNLSQSPGGYALMAVAATSSPRLWVAAKTGAAQTTPDGDRWGLSSIADVAGCTGQYRQGSEASDTTRPVAGRGASW